jgi:hypothetical protein
MGSEFAASRAFPTDMRIALQKIWARAAGKPGMEYKA